MLVQDHTAQRISLRPAEVVCSAEDLGGARATRQSFARQLIRTMLNDRWSVRRTRFDIDEAGRGTAVYAVEAPDFPMSLVLFSQVIDESARTDRVIAESWDVTAALVEGDLSSEKIEEIRPQVTRQEEGRARPGTLIWGRANRSVRFFEQVVSALADGRQPDPHAFGLSPYLLRSTAFYSNGKFGMRDFEGYDEHHVLGVPYRGHMLAAWLFREFSYDLVEHCAAARNPVAAKLNDQWRRYFGLGNATGLGLVPYAVNHPEILNSWLWAREYPLAMALTRRDAPDSAAVRHVGALLERLTVYLAQQGTEEPTPFSSGLRLATALEPVRSFVSEYAASGTIDGVATDTPWLALHTVAEGMGPEIRGIVATAITELTEELDDEIEAALRCVEDRDVDPSVHLSDLLRHILDDYGWIDQFDPLDDIESDRFWFTSANSEEPRRGRTGVDPGIEVQHGVGVAVEVRRLRDAIRRLDPHVTVGEFLVEHPWFRGAVTRVQKVGPLPYGELHVNLRSSEFVPLNPQRLQLAVYGMENFTPQSTDWLRVTLFSGAPRAADLESGGADDQWMFPLRPESECAS